MSVEVWRADFMHIYVNIALFVYIYGGLDIRFCRYFTQVRCFGLCWLLVGKSLPDGSRRLILSCSGSWWANGSQNAPRRLILSFADSLRANDSQMAPEGSF